MATDNNLDAFRGEYEKLAEALKKSVENENKITAKCSELNDEIQQSTSKVQSALKCSQEDETYLEGLKLHIDRTSLLVEASQEKENELKTTIAKLKTEIQELTNKFDQGSSLSKKQEMEILQLAQQRDALSKEREMAESSLELMQHVANDAYKKYEKMEQELDKAQQDIEAMNEKLSEKRLEQDMEQKRKDTLDTELKELRLDLEKQKEESRVKKKSVVVGQEALHQLEMQLLEVESKEHGEENEYKRLLEEKKALESRIEQEVKRKRKFQAENVEKCKQLEAKVTDISRIRSESDKIDLLVSAIQKRVEAAEEQRNQIESDRNKLKAKIEEETEETKRAKKELDSEKKKIEDVLRERDILNKNVIKTDARIRKDIDLVAHEETLRLNIQKDVERWKADNLEVQKAILKLEKEREKYGIELSMANSKRFAALEELKKREIALTAVSKETGEVQTKLNQQKNLYDAVCTDRNLKSKNLIDSNEEIAEMKGEFKMMHHQIQQLKEEIKDRDTQLVKDHAEHQKMVKSNESIAEQIEKSKKKVKNVNSVLETQYEEIERSRTSILEREAEKANQKKQYDCVQAEKEIINAQLARRNADLEIMYEKIKVQRSNISKGHAAYQDCLVNITKSEACIKRLREEFNAAKGRITDTLDMKKEVFSLSKLILQEETKKQALEQELSNPLNVHRWRKVEGSDPQTFELLGKVKQLQKRLIQKSEEVVEKDMLIEEKERLYVQLKTILARQPGPEVSEQLGWYTTNLKEKTQQMQKMGADLEEYHDKVQVYRKEMEFYKADLRKKKQEYFNARKAAERETADEGA